jgi:PAS domain S-box-containing protein
MCKFSRGIKAMPSSLSDENNNKITTALNRLLEIFSLISAGDISHRLDISDLPPDDTLTKVLCKFDTTMDHLEKTQKELHTVKSKLEERVIELTSHLAAANEKLNHEIEERTKTAAKLRQNEEQKKMTLAMDDGEKYLVDVFSSIQDGISILDSKLTIVRVNPKLESLYAHAMPITGKKCFEVYHSRSEPCRACPSVVAIRTKKPSYEVVPYHGENGEVLGWQDLYAFPIFNEADEVKGVIEYVRDITARKQAEENLRQSETLFRTLAETVGAGIFIIKKSKFCYVNPFFVKNIGYSYEELLTKEFFEIAHPDFRKMVQDRHIARLRGENVPNEYEFKYQKKDGTEGWVVLNVGLLEFEGAPAIIGTIYEISERKKAEAALAKEKELLSVTMASIGDGVVSIDTNGSILTINKNALELSGAFQGAVVGRHIDEVMCFIDEKTKNKHKGIIGSMLTRYGYQRHERRATLLSKNGLELLVDFSVAPITTDQGTTVGMVLVFRDVTEKQKLEADLFNARKLESLGVLAGGIAHDFNNILTGIITNLFMAKVKIKCDTDTFQLLDEAEKASFRASKLVKQLLTFSKGGAPFLETVPLKEIIEDAVGFCLSGSNVKYTIDIPPDLLPVEADKGQIDQVLNNLIINADQAMPNGGNIAVHAENVTVKLEDTQPGASFTALGPGNYVKVTVSDEGIGIPKENLEKIFDPYHTTKPHGNGLGLTTAYAIIKSHKGIITVNSQVGKGTVFSFFLPAAKPMQKVQLDKQSPAPDSRDIKVLVMDDDNAIRTVVSQLLKKSGYGVVCSPSGEDTLRTYEAALKTGKRFDVVVMDLTIPGGMGGRETIKKMIELDPTARVVVSSGYSNDPIMANFEDFGFCGAIAKPFIIDLPGAHKREKSQQENCGNEVA